MKPRSLLVTLGSIAAGFIFVIAGRDMLPLVSAESGPQDTPVAVTLLGPLQDIRGVTVPKEVVAGQRRFFQIPEPSVIALALPNGKEVSLPVKTAFVNTDAGVVVDVDLLPLMKTAPFKEAVAELHRLLGVLNITPDERMKEQMSMEWPEDTLGFDPVNRPGFYPHVYRTGMKLQNDVSFGITLRPADDDGWYIVLTFAVSGDTRRRITGLTPLQPAAQPSTRSSDKGG